MNSADIVINSPCSIGFNEFNHAFQSRRKACLLGRQGQVSLGLMLTALMAGAGPTRAAEPSKPSPSVESSEPADAKAKKKATNKDVRSKDQRDHARRRAPAAEPPPMDSAARARALDKVYGFKGWIFPFPSFSESLTQDDNYWRTNLASYGFGFAMQNYGMGQVNTLNTPRKNPPNLPKCTSDNINYNCAGGQMYFGQRPDAQVSGLAFLTYDMSQWGVPDGQIAVLGTYKYSSDQQYGKNALSIAGLSWYQTLFDKKVELKVGYFASLPEFAGTFIGGTTSNPFGSNASIPSIMGWTGNSMGTPNLRVTWHITDELYAIAGVQRSLPVTGIGGGTYSEVSNNPTGLSFTSPVPGTRAVFSNEIGYKALLEPDRRSIWVRGGAWFNTSSFRDYSQLLVDSGARKSDALGFYVLGDYQVWQQAPESAQTAYRGIYLGGTFMYAPPEVSAVTQYYEARAFWLGPFENRPRDMFSVVYGRNEISQYYQTVVNAGSEFTNLFANSSTNSVTASYMYRVRPGLFATVGLGYTDKPSLSYFKGEGSSLNLLFSLYSLL